MDATWTIQRILAWTQQHFIQKGIPSARLDAEVLLAAVLEVSRVHLYTHFDQPLGEEERAAYREAIKRRVAREPVAHILGHKEFYSRDFEVTRDVLVPRPETEHLVDAVLDWLKKNEVTAPEILDIGTGSGAIAVSLACEWPEARVVASDLSDEALAVARRNVEKHGVGERVELLQGDLFEPIRGDGSRRFDVIVSNPPYVDIQQREVVQPEVRDWEPPLALFADDGGMAVVRRLCLDAYAHLKAPGLFACEIGYDQKQAVLEALEPNGPWASLEVASDLQGHPRVALAERGAAPGFSVRKASENDEPGDG